jgi:hypothetical protein
MMCAPLELLRPFSPVHYINFPALGRMAYDDAYAPPARRCAMASLSTLFEIVLDIRRD